MRTSMRLLTALLFACFVATAKAEDICDEQYEHPAGVANCVGLGDGSSGEDGTAMFRRYNAPPNKSSVWKTTLEKEPPIHSMEVEQVSEE